MEEIQYTIFWKSIVVEILNFNLITSPARLGEKHTGPHKADAVFSGQCKHLRRRLVLYGMSATVTYAAVLEATAYLIVV